MFRSEKGQIQEKTRIENVKNRKRPKQKRSQIEEIKK